ncbi:MAG: response regulator transcription factor [Saprospiraceae bacterium]
MKQLNCLIVEDEPLAAGILEDYIHDIPFLCLIGKCGDAIYASEIMQESDVDVLFLDLHLPGLKGLDFLRSLKKAPEVILTTAYHEYALESYSLNVTDYLLKPIDFERFVQAVQKLKSPVASGHHTRPFHFFNANKKMVRVWIDEVLFVESVKEYARIVMTGDKQVFTKISLADLERIFAGYDFLRVHRSFLVALRHIQSFSSSSLQIGDTEISIGRLYREEVLQVLGRL